MAKTYEQGINLALRMIRARRADAESNIEEMVERGAGADEIYHSYYESEIEVCESLERELEKELTK